MNKLNKSERLFLLSLLCFLGMSVSILFMPLASYFPNNANKVITVVTGSVFWISLAAGIFLSVILGKYRKAHCEKEHKHYKERRNLKKIIFGSNLISRLAFFIGIISLLAFFSLLISRILYNYIIVVALFLSVFSLCVFCLFNGKNFIYIKQIREEKQNDEQI